MKKFLKDLSLAAGCLLAVTQAGAQQDIQVADDCSIAIVDGVRGEIWEVTENGKSAWVVLDADNNHLADAPQHCVDMFAESAVDNQPQTPPPAVAQPSRGGSGAAAAVLQHEILQRHNHWRQSIGAPALRWSPPMAEFAQQWATELARQDCALEHRPRSGPFAQRYGENLYAASPVIWSDGHTEVQSVTPAQVVDSWDSEKADYDYNTNACAAGKVCGHYTQLVWAQSKTLGCAMQFCADKGQVWVCNYDPAGNVIGEKPY